MKNRSNKLLTFMPFLIIGILVLWPKPVGAAGPLGLFSIVGLETVRIPSERPGDYRVFSRIQTALDEGDWELAERRLGRFSDRKGSRLAKFNVYQMYIQSYVLQGQFEPAAETLGKLMAELNMGNFLKDEFRHFAVMFESAIADPKTGPAITQFFRFARLNRPPVRKSWDFPKYPEFAIRDKIEGWVVVQLDVTEKGRTRNHQVFESEPPGVFDGAALKSARSFSFMPKLVNGEPAPATSVRYLIQFVLEK